MGKEREGGGGMGMGRESGGEGMGREILVGWRHNCHTH